MTPQVENGFTRIANELLEAVALTKLTSQEFRIVNIVIRLTYGYNRKFAPISISTYCLFTGIDKTSRVSQILNSLEKKKIVEVIRTPGKTKKYCLNKNYTQWIGFNKTAFDTLTKHKEYTLTKHKEYTLTFDKKSMNSLKKSNKKKEYIAHFETFWQSYPKKVAKAKAKSIFLKLKPDQDLLNQMLTAIENQMQLEQWQNEKYIPYPATWLNQKRWQDELEPTKQEPKGFMV